MRASRHVSLALLGPTLILVLVACGAPASTVDPPPPDPPPVDARLFLAVGGGAEVGLYAVDPDSGAATLVGASPTTGSEATGMGLAPGADGDVPLYAAHAFSLYRIDAGPQAPTTVVESLGSYSEALAHDVENGTLYIGINGFLFVHRASDGERVDTLLRPPNQPDMEGMAFDPEERLLYGLARGYPDSHPQAYRSLYALDVDAASPTWSEVGDTGGLWADAGLAFDPESRALYAVGRHGDAGGLFRIDPVSGATTRVGATGLARASGGLAWR